MGAKSRGRGESFEHMLGIVHQRYRVRGDALIYHNGTRAQGYGDTLRMVESLPDYSGILTCAGGRYVVFDAKLRQTPRYRHPAKELHQLEFLFDAAEFRGIAFLLVAVEDKAGYGQAWLVWPDRSWSYPCAGFTIDLRDPAPEAATPIPPWDGVMGSYVPDWLLGLVEAGALQGDALSL